MEKTSVYKLDSKGKLRIWTIWVEGNQELASIEIESGLVDGKKVPESIPVTEGKNIGKANATTPYTQAVSEAKAKLELKLRGEYRLTKEELSQGTLRSGIQAPMLAQKYHPTGEQKGSKTLDKMKIRGHKIHVQPKLDGNRGIITVNCTDGQNIDVVMYTRKGDAMPVQLSHLIQEIKRCYAGLFYGDGCLVDCQELVLDGEFFSTEMSFNELNGHLKRKGSQDEEQLAKIKFHLYDIMVDEGYAQRYEKIKYFIECGENKYLNDVQSLVLVPSYEIVATDENIKEKLEEFLAENNEGLMIRTLHTGYENKRSWQLVKVKLFEDFETELVDIELDSMGRLGAFIMKMPTNSVDRNGKAIETFKAGTTGISHDEGMTILAHKENYIGKPCTIEHFGWSEYLVPRFPKMKQLDRVS